MADNVLIPFYEDASHITGQATAAITGKRFVKPSGNRVSGPEAPTEAMIGDSDPTDGGNYRFAHASAGGPAIGVAEWNAAIGTKVGAITEGIVPVTADGAITAGVLVQVGSAGKATTFDPDSGVDAEAASLDTGVVADDNAITWTANDPGAEGNDITVAMVFSDANVGSTTVDVDGSDIVVTLESSDAASGTILATAAEVIAAVQEHDTASQLVSVDDTGASDGTGVVTAVAETPLSGGSNSTGAPIAVGLAMTGASDGTDAEIKLLT